MKKYKFEIQQLIKVVVEADNKEDARSTVCTNLEDGNYDLELRWDCYVSDGEEVKE